MLLERLHRHKDAAYGDAWRKRGEVIAIFANMARKYARLLVAPRRAGLCLATFDTAALGSLLDELRRRQSIYTAAFILCAHDAYGQPTKHRNRLALVEDMFRRGALGSALSKARSLWDVYEALLAWPLIGPFMAYQLAIDLNYTEHLSFSEDRFTVPGPGAMRGLRKVFSDFDGQSPAELILRMVDRQEEFPRLDLEWQDLFGRRLHAIDCQGVFCETDKYARMAFPELPSNRVRIKSGSPRRRYRWSPSTRRSGRSTTASRRCQSRSLRPLPMSRRSKLSACR